MGGIRAPRSDGWSTYSTTPPPPARAPRLRRASRAPVLPAAAAPPRPRRAAPPLHPASARACPPPPPPTGSPAPAPAPQCRRQGALRLLPAARLRRPLLPSPPPRARRLTFLPLLGCATSLPLLSALHGLLLRLSFLSHHAISLAILKPFPLPYVRDLFDEIPQRNRCTVAYNTLITAYLKTKDRHTARHVFDEMQRYKQSRRSVVSWNAMIASCAWCGRDDMSVWCFESMVEEGEVAPDDGTLAAVLPSCGRMGNVGAGIWAHEYAQKAGLLGRMVHVANAVIDMYCKCGDVGCARMVFERMQHRSVVTWNTMITGCSLNGHGAEGIKLFREMKGHTLEPNVVTFLGVLGCCAHAGAVDVGWGIFQSMQSDYGIEPVIEHYGCMVDLLGRSGLLEEAYTLIQGMPMKPNAAIWGAFLSACRAHAGLGISEVALIELINLEPWNSGNYVLLANLYAETERWKKAGEMRRLMRKMSVNKAPGQSLIEEAEFQFTNGC